MRVFNKAYKAFGKGVALNGLGRAIEADAAFAKAKELGVSG